MSSIQKDKDIPDHVSLAQKIRKILTSVDVFRLRAVDDVTSRIGRGVFKRIDENRELLELLKVRCPQFMAEHPWVEGWLESHDDFFVELAKATRAINPFEEQNRRGLCSFPRPWPGQRRRQSGGMLK